VLSMRFAEVEGHVCKFLTVIKVRGTSHSNELREYRITDAGIEVSPHVTNLDALMTGYPTRREPHK
jgi:circadian clock protein KaiC